MKAQDIHELTDRELEKHLDDAKQEHLNLKIQARTGQLENFSRIRLVRREIARFKTEVNIRLKNKENKL